MNDLLFKCSSCVKESNEHIPIQRLLDKLDIYFNNNDLDGAYSCLLYWEKEADNLLDVNGLIFVLNEEIGLTRRMQNKEKALDSINKLLSLISMREEKKSFEALYVNIATTCKAFNKLDDAQKYYDKAEELFLKFNDQDSYEYAAYLNNRATLEIDLKNYLKAEENYLKAIEILNINSKHDQDIAISYALLAELYKDFKYKENEIESCLENSWNYINSSRCIKDSDYAYACEKIYPTFKLFNKDLESEALLEVAHEIYSRN